MANQKSKKLTNRQRIFVEEYLTDWNGTRAAIAAGYSRRSAAVIAAENLTKPNVKELISARLAEATMKADEVLKRLSDQAKANLLPFVRFTADGACFFNFADEDAKKYFHLIRKIKTKRTRHTEGQGKDAQEWEDEWVEVELHDSQRALELLGKHYKLLGEGFDASVSGKTITVTIRDDED